MGTKVRNVLPLFISSPDGPRNILGNKTLESIIMPYKVCSKCQENNGVRTLKCKKCGEVFITKSKNPHKKRRRVIKTEVSNWKEELSTGDIVRIIQGSGPYYIFKNGDRQYEGVSGLVKIGEITQEGFWATHYKLKQNRGSYFVYMGKECRSPLIDNLIRSKHKVIKLENLPERVTY